MTALDTTTRGSLTRRVVELAGLAPSVHNTQPWLWCRTADGLELHRDLDRALPHADPEGRDLVISCGAALHHAAVAAAAFGLAPTVEPMTEERDPTLLARLRWHEGRPTAEDAARLAALRTRRTDRRRFTSWPVPTARLEALGAAARDAGAHAFVLTDPVAVFRTRELLSWARMRRSDRLRAVEDRVWLDRGPFDGVPREVVPSQSSGETYELPRFEDGTLVDDDVEPDRSDGLLVLGGAADDDAAWLTTGQALSALWLRAERGELAVVPHSDVIETTETRNALRTDVLFGMTRPHLVVRVGWRPIGRSTLPPTPRRPLDDIFRT